MHTRVALVMTLCLAGPLGAQGSTALYSRWNGLSGFDYQSYHFTGNVGVTDASQWSIPVVVVAPLGRQMSLDLTTRLAHSEITDDSTRTLSGLTDTQLRLLYTLGRDRTVASLSVNLPTGQHSLSTSEFQVSSAVGSNFLSFPVGSLGTGFGITGGLAYAVQTGGWSLGFAGSMRYVGSYKPFSDQSLSYKPGLEGRLRAGADRVIGQRSRLLVGLTYSTFSTDQFSGTGTVAGGWYNPGSRFIGDFGYAYSWGRTTIAITAWDFYRLGGRTNTVSGTDTKENVFNSELRVARQLSPRLVLEPLVGFRRWSPGNDRSGRLYSFGVNGRVGLNDQLSALVSARFGSGKVSQSALERADVTATGLSLFLRYQR